MLSVLAGATYALSHAISAPSLSLMVLMVGRALLGAGESLVITGALSWGVALAGRERSLAGLLADAARTESSLEQARAQRASYLASLAARQRLNASSISSLESQAQGIEAEAKRIVPVVPPSGGGGGVTPGSTMTVSATGYSLRGRTATGIPVGWGVVAVDPSVIPLGTRMTIPGYGEGIAADTGSAVVGATIDLWFPTVEMARAWGRRSVTITLD
jgi:3D (Asp-Asp-Asp) domain-containing protein